MKIKKVIGWLIPISIVCICYNVIHCYYTTDETDLMVLVVCLIATISAYVLTKIN